MPCPDWVAARPRARSCTKFYALKIVGRLRSPPMPSVIRGFWSKLRLSDSVDKWSRVEGFKRRICAETIACGSSIS